MGDTSLFASSKVGQGAPWVRHSPDHSERDSARQSASVIQGGDWCNQGQSLAMQLVRAPVFHLARGGAIVCLLAADASHLTGLGTKVANLRVRCGSVRFHDRG